MARQIQINSELFYGLYRLIVLEEQNEELYQQAKQQLETKFTKLLNHELYSQFRTATSADEREQARKDYLESIGIHKDFQW
jgi:hypothetical protein